jgi:hypothetical protein
MRWDYNALADKEALAETLKSRSLSPTGCDCGCVYSGNLCVCATPNAANCGWNSSIRIEGQLIWLKGGCHPFATMICVAQRYPGGHCCKTASGRGVCQSGIPSIEQIYNSKVVIAEKWMDVVGADVSKPTLKLCRSSGTRLRRSRHARWRDWLGSRHFSCLPSFHCLTLSVLIGSAFRDVSGQITLRIFVGLFAPEILNAYWGPFASAL